MAGLEAVVAGAIVSPLVEIVVKKAVSLSYSSGHEFFGARTELSKAVRELHMKLAAIKKIQEAVKQESIWLDELKDAAYEAEAILDEIEYERLKHQVKKFSFSSVFNIRPLLLRVREIVTKLGTILETASTTESLHNHLRYNNPHQGENVSSIRETSSGIDCKQLFGRDDIRDHIIHWLLDGDKKPLESPHTVVNEDVTVLSIYGMGGIGKSALAQHIYNHEDVKSHFELRAWVFVSENFNFKKIMKDILRSARSTTSHKSETANGGRVLTRLASENKTSASGGDTLEVLQQQLADKLTEIRFLIILDDVWNEDISSWEKLRNCLTCRKSGSKIMVTCRTEKVAKLMTTPTIDPISLSGLDMDKFLPLFEKHATGDTYASDEFETIGQQIAEKLNGSPLAAKAIGQILLSNFNINYWRQVLDSELWELHQTNNEIMSALLLSYQHLPNYLKPCFLYLSLFPKGREISVNEIIRHWIAQGFVQTKNPKDNLIYVGKEYIKELKNRSLVYYEKDGEDDDDGDGDGDNDGHGDGDDDDNDNKDKEEIGGFIEEVDRDIDDDAHISALVEEDNEDDDANNDEDKEDYDVNDDTSVDGDDNEECDDDDEDEEDDDFDDNYCYYDDEWISMHDFMYDMARMVSKDEIFVITDNNFKHIPKKVRHLSISLQGSKMEWMNLISQIEVNNLHSLIVDGRFSLNLHAQNKDFMIFVEKILCEGKRLKLLSMKYVGIKSLSSSITNLKHLRYLSLLGNPIIALPKSLSCLYHLQCLILSQCDKLETLPKQMNSLLNLVYFEGDYNLLDIECFRRIKSVEELTFKVLYTKEHTVKELAGLDDICCLTIEGLENIKNKEEAMQAKLEDKKCLEVLHLTWSSNVSLSNRTGNAKEVLEGLQPNSQLQDLCIENYTDAACPSWMSCDYLPNLQHIRFTKCSQLKEISTSDYIQEGIQTIWLTDCGQLEKIPISSEDNTFFPENLSVLCISNCGDFGNSLQWTHLAHLKFLEHLSLKGCGSIEYLPTQELESLGFLEVDDCEMLSENEGIGSLMALTNIGVLKIFKCHKLLQDLVRRDDGLPSTLWRLGIGEYPGESLFSPTVYRLELYDSSKLRSVPIETLHLVYRLKISNCPNLHPTKMPNGGQLESMEDSRIEHFHIDSTSVANLKEWLRFFKSSGLSKLKIQHISGLKSSVMINELGGLLADISSLTVLYLKDLDDLQSLPESLSEHPSLRALKLNNCPRIKSLSASMFPDSMKLKIVDCADLLKQGLPETEFIEISPARYTVKHTARTRKMWAGPRWQSKERVRGGA